jgi:hypothetical protein
MARPTAAARRIAQVSVEMRARRLDMKVSFGRERGTRKRCAAAAEFLREEVTRRRD